MHDPLSISDLVHDELRQRIESGYDVSGIEADLAATSTDDGDRLEALYLELIKTDRGSEWAYQEPASSRRSWTLCRPAARGGNRRSTTGSGSG